VLDITGITEAIPLYGTVDEADEGIRHQLTRHGLVASLGASGDGGLGAG
jgi:hypothetical protein